MNFQQSNIYKHVPSGKLWPEIKQRVCSRIISFFFWITFQRQKERLFCYVIFHQFITLLRLHPCTLASLSFPFLSCSLSAVNVMGSLCV